MAPGYLQHLLFHCLYAWIVRGRQQAINVEALDSASCHLREGCHLHPGDHRVGARAMEAQHADRPPNDRR
eukprot:CAMPEP_0115320978 /NCGR_PEP_ID=MMETSP0270-20121206/80614_1 /TAXON_ID=71861 /ORGANISM="Scrippsiella trochoidea, Strain CCMP3099" /LENGTH=69 /DNA_ID=CAMNT_0002740827 /DNA_START=497 /DNA_END=706 /DNA_ORIENTATION=-